MVHYLNAQYSELNNAQNLTNVCYRIIPSSITSYGMFGEAKFIHFWKYSLPLLELQIGLICILNHTIHFFLKRFGTTELISQILTGIILGPSLFGRLHFMRNIIFPHESQDLVFILAYFGYTIFMFMSYAKLEVGKLLRTSKLVIYNGLGIVIVPIFLGMSVIGIHREKLKEDGLIGEAINVTIMQCFSTFSIIANILEELEILNSEIGRLVLSSALVGDILGIALLSIVTPLMARLPIENILIDAFAVVAFSMVAAFIFRPTMLWIIRKTPQGSPVDSAYILVIMAVMFLSTAYFHSFHQYGSIASAILGFAVPAGPPLGSALVEKFETVTLKLLVPIGVVQAVMRADLALIFTNFSAIRFYVILALLIFGCKIALSLTAAIYAKIPLTDSFLYAAVMNCRGIVDIRMNLNARDIGTVGADAYAFLTFGVFVSSAFSSTIVKCYYDPSKKYAGYQARNIMSLKPQSHLPILACIHKSDHVTSVISLLEAFHPAKDRPIDVCVIHLIKLIGRATPTLTSHQKQRLITVPQSQNVVISFTQYQINKYDSVRVSAFTAMNKPKMMNEDISTLALDKLTSLILLPLHRQWSIHGRIASEDADIRIVNCKVLEKAPCSVGIFFDRGKLGHPFSTAATTKPSLSICMIFIGGGDDREALSLSKRIVKDSSTRLTVIHLVTESLDVESKDNDDIMIDSWALKDLIENQTDPLSNIEYREKIVKDGPETALILHSIVDEYDLFILGRRHDEKTPQILGLSEWTEIPELGIIGDLLASKDFNTRVAVLVVQQQKQIRLGS